MSKPRIIADSNIPYVMEAFGHLGAVERRPGRSIGPEDVVNADVLLVRSVTEVGPSLLDNSSVQFVGSATIGTDHVDQQYLEEEGIAFAHAPGSNADSVADYVVAALLTLARDHGVPLSKQTVGVVGCGNIGSRVARRLEVFGLSVLRNDPPVARAARGGALTPEFVPLARVLQEADIVTLHVPLTLSGRDKTHHLIDDEALRTLQRGAWLLNTSRGAAVDNAALLRAVRGDQIGAVALDVWENEPTPDPELVRAVDLATPHIAGYAQDGKVRGTKMLYTAVCDHLGVEEVWSPERALESATPDALRCCPPDPRLSRTDWFHHLTRQAYNVRADDARLREMLDKPPSEHGEYFAHLRSTYPTRREFHQFSVSEEALPEKYRRVVRKGCTMTFRNGHYDR